MSETKFFTREDLTQKILERDGEEVTITTDTSGKLLEIMYSSAPELSYPTQAMTLRIESDTQATLELTQYAVFPDPAEDENEFYDDADDEESDPAAEDFEERAIKFREWAMNYIDLMQYQAEAHRHNIPVCSFCLKSPTDVGNIIGGPHGVAICEECVDLCEDALAEDGDGQDS